MTHPASLVSSLKRPLTQSGVLSKLEKEEASPFFSGPGRTQQLRQLVRPFHPPLSPPGEGDGGNQELQNGQRWGGSAGARFSCCRIAYGGRRKRSGKGGGEKSEDAPAGVDVVFPGPHR